LDEERNTALFFKPADVAFGEDGKIYVADGYGNSRIAMFDNEGNFLKTWGEKGAEDGNFDNPHNIVVDKKGTVYVADRHNNRIQLFDANGDFLESWTNLGTPWGLAIYKDTLYMTDGNNEKILHLSLKGKILGAYENPGKKAGQFRAAHGITVDESGAIYVTEVFNWRVQKFTVK
jgi:DNA-binding beta-propeller fold protein YncE